MGEFRIPGWTLVYVLASGLVEMLLLGLLYGLTLRRPGLG